MNLDLPPCSYRADPAVPEFDDGGLRTVMDAQCSVCAKGAHFVSEEDGVFRFDVSIRAPVIGPIVGCTGWLKPDL